MTLPQGFFFGIDVLGSTLLHFLWQGALLGLIYLLLRPMCIGVSARYRLGMGFLLALAACPLFTMIFLWPVSDTAGHAVAATGLPLLAGTTAGTIGAVADRAASSWDIKPLLPWFVAVWLCGVSLIALRSLWHWRRLSRLVRQASEPSAYWRTYLARACERFGLVRPVRLLCSASAVTPMLIGWIKPVILLPASMFSGFTPQQIELIIAHELGHIRRWDYLANLFQVVIETVLFYHPVVHWISRDVRNARESCCDDLVLSVANGNPLTYARALANLEELRHDLNLIAPALGAGGGVLLTRIRRIVGVAEMLDPLPRSNAWPLLLAAAAVVCLAWRPQHVASELSVALSAAPAQTLAMVSGNPRLAAAAVSNVPMPSSIPTIVPMTASPNAQAAAEDTTSAPALVHIARPRVNIGAASHLDRVHDLAVATPVATRIADIAEPVSVPLSPPPSAVDAKPSPLHVVAPAYPSRAMAAGIEGNVELEFAVGADGRVRDVRVVHAQPDREFDAAAKAALAAWRFPASQSSDRYTQTFTFTLHARAADDSGATCQQLTGSLICRRPGE